MKRTAKPRTYNRQIGLAFIWVGSFILFAKIAGAAKEIAIASRYGVSDVVDAYVFLFTLISWPAAVWFSVLTMLLLPLLARLRQKSPELISSFNSELLGLTLLMGAGLGISAWFGFPLLLKGGWLHLAPVTRDLALAMIRPLTLLIPLGLVVSLYSASMMALGKHRNTLLEAVPAISILIALHMPADLVPRPLVWGTIAGFALHLIALLFPMATLGAAEWPSFRFTSPAWRSFWQSISVIFIGQVLSSATGIVDQVVAANLAPGALATLSYVNRLLALILGLGALAISRATLPVFSEVIALGSQLHTIAFRWAGWLLICGVAVSSIAAAFAKPFVILIFQRGAFGPGESEMVSSILQYALLQVPPYFSGLVLVAALAASGKYKAIAFSGAANLTIKMCCTPLLAELFQLRGLVISTALMYTTSFGILFFALKRTPQPSAAP